MVRINYHGCNLSRVDEQNEGVDLTSQSSCEDEETPLFNTLSGRSGRQPELSLNFSFSSDCDGKSANGGTSTTQTIYSDTSESDAWLSSSPVKKAKKGGTKIDLDLESIEAEEIRKLLRKDSKKKKKRKSRREEKHLKELYSTFEQERCMLMEKWKEEFKEEQRKQASCCERLQERVDAAISSLGAKIQEFLITAETFVCNLPLTVGAIAIAWVTMGVDWWKYTEEMLPSCTPVHFRSEHCTFPEFPGCFECLDKQDIYYKAALHFHYFCDGFAAILLLGFAAKCLLAWEIVADELSNPTTSTPCGLVLITTCIIAAGQGPIGEMIVLAASSVHLLLFGWFFFMAFKYRMLPDPSWGPNTVGICYPAVKSWLYYGVPGQMLMALCLISFAVTFPMSVLRAWLNRKMSAIVAWIQMSGPAVTLYALTLMTQPTHKHQVLIETDPEIAMEYRQWHLKYIMPIFHALFVCCLIGSVSSVAGLVTRWETFRHNAFSPAHAAFCFPILSHANAIQAYRGELNSLMQLPSDHWYSRFVYGYWLLFLIPGSLTTIAITARFLYNLPAWTSPDVDEEVEPPAPNNTMVHDVLMTGDAIRQPFVSPTVLQANETGVLMHRRRDTADFATKGRYVRTLMVPSLGFEPKLDAQTVATEREELLDWVAKHPPKPRHSRISSNPAKLYGTFFGSRDADDEEAAHRRSRTLF